MAGLLAALLMLAFIWLRNRPIEPPPPEAVWLTVLNPQGQEQQVELESFLLGVVAAEMPASFEPAALAAQAVAARTYIRQALDAPRHGRAAVCCDSTCCQAWLSPEQLRQQWGRQATVYQRKLTAAIAASQGAVLLWQGQPALAVFCSACGGQTESAGAVWGRELPYLQPVPCGWCSHASRYSGAFHYTLEEAGALLEVSGPDLRQLAVTARTPGGRVAQAVCPGGAWSGVELRSRLGLNSTACTWLISGEDMVFFTLGYGHGVGLCQYGADGLAQTGATWQEILAQYYPGCTLGAW